MLHSESSFSFYQTFVTYFNRTPLYICIFILLKKATVVAETSKNNIFSQCQLINSIFFLLSYIIVVKNLSNLSRKKTSKTKYPSHPTFTESVLLRRWLLHVYHVPSIMAIFIWSHLSFFRIPLELDNDDEIIRAYYGQLYRKEMFTAKLNTALL